MINLLKNKYDLDTSTTCDVGIWRGNNKICAAGMQLKERITMHGIALNCNNDLRGFSYIIPCGLIGKGVTSISKELGEDVSTEDVIPSFIDEFQKNLDIEVVDG